MKYFHVDVFADRIFCGNGLTVVFPQQSLAASTMLSIAQEFKQFETAFVFPRTAAGYPLRVFTVQEELDFAGHPVLGVGALLHVIHHPDQAAVSIDVLLGGRKLELRSTRTGDQASVVMDQGHPIFDGPLDQGHYEDIGARLNLSLGDLATEYPVEVVSTGLPYLLVPVKSHLEKARIMGEGFEEFLAGFGAKFVYLFDPATLECRTWDNTGAFEDVATGSAAGPLIGYLVKHKIKAMDELIELRQGRFVQRPSTIKGSWSAQSGISIAGNVAFFGSGEIAIGSLGGLSAG